MAGKPGGGLSSEQIRRMEENRRLAQQRLSNKRVAAVPAAPQQEWCAPPPAKRLALNSGPPGQQYQSHERKTIELSRHSASDRDSFLQRRPTDPAVASSSCQQTTTCSRLSLPSGTSFSTGLSRDTGRPAVSREAGAISSAAPSSSTQKVSDLRFVCLYACLCGCVGVGARDRGLQ